MLGGNVTVTDVDKKFAAVLLQLSRLISESDFSLPRWGRKKKKRTPRKRRQLSDDKKKDPVATDGAIPNPEEPTMSKPWPVVSSPTPNTPMNNSFPANSDMKRVTKRKTTKRPRKEDYVLLITQLEKETESLKRQIEDFQRKKKDAMVVNALLKTKRQELILAQEREKDAKFGEVNTDLTLGRNWSPPLSSSSTADSGGLPATVDQQQPLILNSTVAITDNGHSFFPAETRSLLLNLNVAPDRKDAAAECQVSSNHQPSDAYVDKVATATLAWQNRRRILNPKKAEAHECFYFVRFSGHTKL